MTFEQYWHRREKEIEHIYTKLNLKWLKKEAKFSWNEALTNTVSMNSDAILTSAMHSDGEKLGRFNVKLKTSELPRWKSTSKF